MPDPSNTDTTATSAATVTTDPSPVTPPAQVQASAPKTFTQEEVDQIVKSRLERGQRKPDAPPLKAEAKAIEPASTAAPSIDDIDRRIERHGQFVRVTTTAGLDDAQSRILGDLMRAANPPDVAAWCGDTIAALKLGKSSAPPAVQTQAPATANAPTEAPKPAAAPAAPSAHTLPTANGVPDLFSMTPAQHAALGPQGVRSALEQLWKIGNQMSGAPERPKAPTQR